MSASDTSKTTIRSSHDPAFVNIYDLHAYYGESYIVQGVGFDIREGETQTTATGRAHRRHGAP